MIALTGPTCGDRYRDRVRWGAAAVLMAAVAACQSTPSPPVVALPSPSVSASAPVAVTQPASLDPADVQVHALPETYVPGASLLSSHGQLVWSAGEVWPSEAWRYQPGAAEPERLWSSPRHDANITDIVAGASGFALVELSESAFGAGGWRIWFLAGPDTEPFELDRGQARGAGHPPTIAMDERHIVWASFDEPGSGPVSRLRMASIADLGKVTTVLEAPIRERLLWYPALNGDELWFGTIVADFEQTGVGDEFHIEMLDLRDPVARPVRFAGVANDFHPAVNDDFVVWKTVDPGDAALNWGTVHILDRRTEARQTVPVPDTNRPSLGDRYVAFDEIGFDRLAVYDLVARKLVEIRRSGEAGGIHYGGQSVSGRLLSFFTQVDGGLPRIGWAMLPE